MFVYAYICTYVLSKHIIYLQICVYVEMGIYIYIYIYIYSSPTDAMCVCVCVCVCALCLCGCPHLLTSVAMAECSTCYGCVGDSMPLMVVAPTLSNSLFGNSYMYIYIYMYWFSFRCKYIRLHFAKGAK